METGQSDSETFAHMMHVGMVVRDINQAVERFTALGIGPFKPKNPPPDACETYRGRPFIPSQRVTIQAAQIGNIELELIQPIGGESPHQEFLDSKGEGIHHIGFVVKNLAGDVQRLTEQGSTLLLTSQFKNGGGVAYLDLDAAGLIVELVQRGG